MALTAKATGGGSRELIPDGAHIAVCYGIVDIGTHMNPVFNKESRKVVLMWELPDVRIKIKKDGEAEKEVPRVISKTFTLSLHEKSVLRPALESWRGKKFTDAELEGFDIKKVLGKPCLLQILHERSKKGDQVYSNIGAIMSLPKGTAKPEGEMPEVWFSFEEYAGGDLPALPDWIVKKIEESKEWKKAEQPDEPDESRPTDGPDEDDDSLPF